MDGLQFVIDQFGWTALAFHGAILVVVLAVFVYGLVYKKLPTILAVTIVGTMLAAFALSFALTLIGL